MGRYPANKLIGRELILGRRTHGTAFQHLLAKVLHMSALALLSKSYSPPEGRLPTHYSPVCHFTTVLLQLLVRLACVKRAASVRSEPGSNSQYWNRKTKTQGPPLQYTLFSCQRAEAFASRICDYKKNRDAKSRADIRYSISNVLCSATHFVTHEFDARQGFVKTFRCFIFDYFFGLLLTAALRGHDS